MTSQDQLEVKEAPPAYDSIFGKLKEMKENTNSPTEYVKSSSSLCMKTAGGIATVFGMILCGALGIALPIAEITIGSIYLHDCPKDYLVPIYLIVSGVVGMLTGGSSSGPRIHSHFSKKNDDEEACEQNPKTAKRRTIGNCFSSILTSFSFAWFIAGSIWVFRMRGTVQHTNPGASNYCNRTLYLFAFYELIVKYALTAAGIFCCSCLCFVCMCAYCSGSKKGKNTAPQ